MNHLTEYFKRQVVAPLINAVGKTVKALGIRVASLEGDTIRAWNSTATYAVGDWVTLSGKLYRAVAISTNQNPSTDVTNTYWTPEPNIKDWTPSLAGSTTPGTLTYTTQVGRMYRTDTVVFVMFTIEVATYGADGVGDLLIQDLPYPVADVPISLGVGSVFIDQLSTDQGNVTIEAVPNTSTLILKTGSGGTGAATVIPVTQLTGTTTIRGQIMYEAPEL